jgi:transcriptional regulator with XRE-family HTH domain
VSLATRRWASTSGADGYVRGGRTLADVGTELAHLRRERGLSPDDLARRGGLPRETVAVLESGTRLPTSQEFTRLAAGLGLTADRLAVLLRPVVQHQASGIRTFGELSVGPVGDE